MPPALDFALIYATRLAVVFLVSYFVARTRRRTCIWDIRASRSNLIKGLIAFFVASAVEFMVVGGTLPAIISVLIQFYGVYTIVRALYRMQDLKRGIAATATAP